ncbi:TolC family protein [Luteimonas sp. A277]
MSLFVSAVHAGLQVQSADVRNILIEAPADPSRSCVSPAGSEVGTEAAPAAELTWHEAVRIAVTRHPSVLAAQATVQQQSSLIDAARAGYRPRVQAEVTAGEQGEFGTGQVATVGLTQMLYDFGKTSSAVERERAGERREQAALLQAVDEVLESTVQALIEIHRHEALRALIQEQLESLGKVVEITELRAEAGAATRSDPLQARSRVEAVRARLLAVDSQLRQWRTRLGTYVGARGGAPVASAPEAALQWASTDADIERLPALQVASAQREAAHADHRNARAQRYPTVALEANANRRLGQAGDRYEDMYGRNSYTTTFLSVRGSLYEGGEMSARARAGASAVEAAEGRVQAERLAALDDLHSYREQIEGLGRRLGVLQQRVSSITETRDLYWEQYLALGTRNALDLLNAEQEIGQSREDLENARHDLWVAQLGHLLSAGRARQAFDLETP